MPLIIDFEYQAQQFVLQHSVSRLKQDIADSENVYIWGDGAGAYADVNGGGFNTQTQQDELASDVDQVIGLREISRVEKKVRVYQNNNPTSENWVDVAYCESLLCQSDRDQKMYRFFLNPNS